MNLLLQRMFCYKQMVEQINKKRRWRVRAMTVEINRCEDNAPGWRAAADAFVWYTFFSQMSSASGSDMYDDVRMNFSRPSG